MYLNNCLKYKHYKACITFDADDEIFVGTVLNTNDSLTFHGKSVDELKDKFIQCIETYEAFLKKEIGYI